VHLPAAGTEGILRRWIASGNRCIQRGGLVNDEETYLILMEAPVKVEETLHILVKASVSSEETLAQAFGDIR
jgi:hypothetical protein